MLVLRCAIWFGALTSMIALAQGPVAATEPQLGIQIAPNGAPYAAVTELRRDPRHIVDARVPPYTAVGRLTGLMICTGALVADPRIVVTAAHCVVEHDGKVTVSKLTFQPGYQMGLALDRFSGEVWAVGSLRQFEYVTVHDASNDWAIVVLDRSADPIRPLWVRSYGRETDGPLEGNILLPAYSDDFAGADVLAVDTACSVDKIVWEILLHDCAVSHGASGAPLLVRDGDWYAVIGINSGAMAFPTSRGRRIVHRNAAIGSSFFAAALADVHERLLDGRGRGCRYEWVSRKAPAGIPEPRTC